MKKRYLAALSMLVLMSVAAYAAPPVSIQQLFQNAPKETAPQGSTRIVTVRGGVLRQMSYSSVKGSAGGGTATITSGTTPTNVTGVLKGNGSVVGTAATTADLPDSANKRYLTDVQQTVLGNTSGTNTGDQSLSGLLPVNNPTATGTVTAPIFSSNSADHMIECANAGAMTVTGLTSANAGRFCYDQSLAKFRYWNGSALADMVTAGTGGASSLAELSDWPVAVSATEVGYLNGVTSGIQAQINGLAGGGSGYVSVPTYSNSTCTPGQWAAGPGYHYACVASNTWDRVALAAWNNPALLYSINEGFESGLDVNPTDWWNDGGVQYNYPTAGLNLDGSYCLRISSAGSAALGHTPAATIYSSVHLRLSALPSTETGYYLTIRDSTDTDIGLVMITVSGEIGAVAMGGTENYSTPVITANTTIYLKTKYVKGTGSNAALTVWTSTDGTTWTQRVASTNGTSTTQAEIFRLGGYALASYAYIDTLKISSVDITDARSGY